MDEWFSPALKLMTRTIEIGGIAVRCDVTEWEDQEALVQRALERDAVRQRRPRGGGDGRQQVGPDERRVVRRADGIALHDHVDDDFGIQPGMVLLREAQSVISERMGQAGLDQVSEMTWSRAVNTLLAT